MNRARRHPPSCLPEQHLQLARSPVRIALPQFHHLLLPLASGPPRTDMRPTAALGDAGQPLFLIAPQPQISRGSRYLELLTENPESLLPPTRRHYEPHALFLNVHTPPRHPSSRPRARQAPTRGASRSANLTKTTS